jgi:hypothetical protein
VLHLITWTAHSATTRAVICIWLCDAQPQSIESRLSLLSPKPQENVVAALPHDSHFMGILLAEISALSTCHPEQNPALAGQNVYQDKEIVDKQILRLIGRV